MTSARADIILGGFIGRWVSVAPCGLWPFQSTAWWPQPRADEASANASWEVSHCPECRKYAARLYAVRDIPAGEEIIARPCRTFLASPVRFLRFLITFDGGAREIRGRRVAGAGAILWGPPDLNGDRPRLRVASIALPGEQFAQVAEAWGLRLGCLLLLGEGAGLDGERTALMSGDNLPVIRYGAGQGRLHRPEMQGILESVLHQLPACGWRLEWVAVRRCFNAAADELATAALLFAADIAEGGSLLPHRY